METILIHLAFTWATGRSVNCLAASSFEMFGQHVFLYQVSAFVFFSYNFKYTLYCEILNYFIVGQSDFISDVIFESLRRVNLYSPSFKITSISRLTFLSLPGEFRFSARVETLIGWVPRARHLVHFSTPLILNF